MKPNPKNRNTQKNAHHPYLGLGETLVLRHDFMQAKFYPLGAKLLFRDRNDKVISWKFHRVKILHG